MRQKDDLIFAQMLSDLANCTNTEKVYEFFTGRVVNTAPTEYLHLFERRVDCKSHNDLRMRATTSEEICSNSNDTCKEKM